MIDYNLPDANGYDLLEYLTRHWCMGNGRGGKSAATRTSVSTDEDSGDSSAVVLFSS
jgi:hypothetical protein